MSTKQKILITISFIVIYVFLVLAFAYVGDTRILPCKIKCGELSSSDEFFISKTKELENTNYCFLHGLNIMESKYGCKTKPFIYTSNIFYSVLYLLIFPLIITIFLVKTLKKKIKTKNFE
jgi:hypothetical protein